MSKHDAVDPAKERDRAIETQTVTLPPGLSAEQSAWQLAFRLRQKRSGRPGDQGTRDSKLGASKQSRVRKLGTGVMMKIIVADENRMSKPFW